MKYRHILTTGLLVIIASMFGFGAAIAEDEAQASAEPIICPPGDLYCCDPDDENCCIPGVNCCRRPDWICANYPPMFGMSCEVSGACESTFPYEGEDCLKQSRGDGVRVIAFSEVDDHSKRPMDWLVKHDKDSVLTGIGLACLINAIAPKISFLELPDSGHCAALLMNSSSEVYLEFFANLPFCHGWVECSCE